MNPLQAYADSYRQMARIGSGQVGALSVAVDIERNMIQHAVCITDSECAAVQLQEPVNGCGDDCGCPFNMKAKQLEGLRALRLHHWQAVLRLRSYAADADMRKSDSEHYNKRANFHLTQVQLFNDFFPIGDTAEHDNAQLPPKV